MCHNDFNLFDEFAYDIEPTDQVKTDMNKIPRSPHVLCKVHDYEIWALLDSGSQVTAIAENFIIKLHKRKNY